MTPWRSRTDPHCGRGRPPRPRTAGGMPGFPQGGSHLWTSLAATLVITCFSARKSSGASAYFAAGRRITGWQSGLAYRLSRKLVRAAASLSTLTVSIFYMITQMVGAGALVRQLIPGEEVRVARITAFVVGAIIRGGAPLKKRPLGREVHRTQSPCQHRPGFREGQPALTSRPTLRHPLRVSPQSGKYCIEPLPVVLHARLWPKMIV